MTRLQREGKSKDLLSIATKNHSNVKEKLLVELYIRETESIIINKYLKDILVNEDNNNIVSFGNNVPNETGHSCEECNSNDASLTLDPYMAEIENDYTKHYLCQDCLNRIAEEI